MDAKTREQCGELEEAAGLLSDEIGELWGFMSQLGPYVQFTSDEFRVAWQSEVSRLHDDMTTNYRFVERTYRKPVRQKILVHVDEIEP